MKGETIRHESVDPLNELVTSHTQLFLFHSEIFSRDKSDGREKMKVCVSQYDITFQLCIASGNSMAWRKGVRYLIRQRFSWMLGFKRL